MPVVLCYGDSNTHGTPPMAGPDEVRRFGPGVRWPSVMAAELGPDWRVIEEGLPGRTTVHDDPIEGAWKNGLAVLPAVLQSHRPLDLVLLMLGTNDLKARFAVTATDIAESCGRLVDCLRGLGVGPEGGVPAVLLVAPPPIAETGLFADVFTGGAAKSGDFAERFAWVARRRGVAFFDAATVAAVDPRDGIHYAADTHAALGMALAGAVRQSWENAAG